jgi:Ca2+-dependent lipid-binding protein
VDTLSPVWNELWRVKNVPATAQLTVEVLDKDNGPTDDFIGRFSCDVSAGAKEFEIESAHLKRSKGKFWLKVRRRSYSRTLDILIVS